MPQVVTNNYMFKFSTKDAKIILVVVLVFIVDFEQVLLY